MDDSACVTVVDSQGEADIILGLLRANGIRCGQRGPEIAAPNSGPFSAAREILVNKDDLETARQLLAAAPREK
jgi:hypothetical protein